MLSILGIIRCSPGIMEECISCNFEIQISYTNMSAIEKLQVRGIRSFSPLRDETIEFYSPLTMIVGANG